MTSAQPKTFNTAGPCIPSMHYMLPALPRMPNIHKLIDTQRYFVLHAPRQSGKTTVIQAIVDMVNAQGSYYAMYCDLEHDSYNLDPRDSMRIILGSLDQALAKSPVGALRKARSDGFWTVPEGQLNLEPHPLQEYLNALCLALDKELVIFFDEADCLKETVIISFLTQLRRGYLIRSSNPFPRSIALTGMLNIRDYKAKVRPESETIGSGSPFNFIAESLTLANFNESQIHELYSQHTEATGQIFQEGAIQRAWYWSEGQPWLVNALAMETVERILFDDYKIDITAKHIDIAADNIIRRRDTHIDSMLKYLSDPRVKRFIDTMIEGSENSALKGKLGETRESLNNDVQYCLDLGIFKQIDKELCPANPIYSSIIVRSFNEDIQYSLSSDLIGKWMD
jgi:hypothetical protein